MTSPLVNFITAEEGKAELKQLMDNLPSSLDEFTRRAHCYELTAQERGTWERIEDLRWLLDLE